jgi:lipopolysaccharide export system protein LptC
MHLMRFVPILVAAVLALATWWLAEQAKRGFLPQHPTSPTNPDFLVENVNITRIDPSGLAYTLVSAVRMTHQQQDDLSILEQPRVVQARPGAAMVHIEAEHGTSRNRNEVIDLTGKVSVVRDAAAGISGMVMTTEQLQLRPDDDTASSRVFVRIERNGSWTEGVGMDFRNAYRQIDIHSKARGSIAIAQQDSK